MSYMAVAVGGSALLGYVGTKSSNKAARDAAKPKVWDGADAQARGLMPDLQSLYQQGGFAAGPTAPELAGRGANWDYATGPLQPMIDNAQASWQRGLSGEVNPYVTQMIDSAQNDLMQDYRTITAPQRDLGMLGAGQYGGSRQAVGQSMDRRNLMDDMKDVSTGMLNNAWNQSQQQQQAAWNASTQMGMLGMLPGDIQQQVGNQYRQDQMVPGQNAQGYANAIAPWATPSGGGVAQQQSPIGNAVGGAFTGAGIVNVWDKYQNQQPARPAGQQGPLTSSGGWY